MRSPLVLRTLRLLAGFSAITASAWVAFGLAAGLLVLGLSLIVIDYLAGDDQ
jgi:hypothetical protein